tara:strand:+ start:342 stop:605 length:264 start_codon:yes stop_codon:yes gene_type:complete
MSKELKQRPLDIGGCVEILAVSARSGKIINEYGIILSHQLVEMEDDLYEFLYTVHSSSGIEDYWPYEIKLVNTDKTDYNNIATHTQR